MAYDGRLTVAVAVGLSVWLGLLGWGVWRGRCAERARLLLVLALALPPLVTFLLSLRRPTYVDRFFVGSLLAFLLLAAGLARLPRSARCVAGAVLCGLGLWGVARFHTDPAFTKEDWRRAAAYVEAHEMPGDVLALRHFQYVIPFRYYYRGALEPIAVTLNQQTTPLEEIAAGHERLWLILRGRHDDLHHLAWSEPFTLGRNEADPEVLPWITARLPEEIVVFPGLAVVRFDRP
jgi:hypothetical protein